MDEFVNLISNLGFPIACAVAMFWMLNSERTAHKEEVDTLRDAILELKEVCQSIRDKLGGGGA